MGCSGAMMRRFSSAMSGAIVGEQGSYECDDMVQ